MKPDSFHSAQLVQVPLNGLPQSGFESVGGLPAEFGLNLFRIDGIAAVMAGAVRDEGDEAARVTTQRGGQFIYHIADHLHEMQVGQFVLAAYIVSLPGFAAGENVPQRLTMVADMEPVAHVEAIAINGDGLAAQHFLNDDGNELFRELIRAVVVRAARDDGWQAVGVVVAAHEHVAGGLAGGVGRVRCVR